MEQDDATWVGCCSGWRIFLDWQHICVELYCEQGEDVSDIANKISTVHEGSRPDQWNHVDTGSNPADNTSRGLPAGEQIHKNHWTNGPSFLWEVENCWPKQPDIPVEIKDDPEVKKEKKTFSVASTVEADFLNRMVQCVDLTLPL